MCVEHKDWQEPDDAEFERKLRVAMQRQAAPVGMKQRVLAHARELRQARHGRMWMVQRIAASVVLATLVGGFAVYRQVQERETAREMEQRKGEQAREQVLTAMRITTRALDRVNRRLVEQSR
jgi:hypothetical protein